MSRLKTRSTCSLCFRYPNIKRTVINVKSSLQMKLDSEVRRAIDSHLPRNCNETFPRSETMRKLSRIDSSLSLSSDLFPCYLPLVFFFLFILPSLSLFLESRDGGKWSRRRQSIGYSKFPWKVLRAWITELNRRMLIARYHACNARWILTCSKRESDEKVWLSPRVRWFVCFPNLARFALNF